MAIKAIINNTEKEIEQIKNSNEQDIDYVYSRIGDTEVEGESPISIKSIGGNLADYRIYGQTVDGESLGDRTGNLWDETIIQGGTNNTGTITDGNPKRLRSDYIFVEPGETYSFASNLKIRLIYSYDDNNQKVSLIRDAPLGDISYTFTVPNAATKIIITVMKRIYNVEYDITPDDFEWGQLEKGSVVTSYEPYGYRVPVTVEGKNLLQNTATSQTKNGVTITVNSDGSVTCNGTADKATWFDINRAFDVYAPDGRIASIGNQGSLDTFYMNIGVAGIGVVINSYKYSRTTHNNAWIHIVIASGYTCDNLTLYPMIRKADIEDDTYVPYRTPVTTPIYLPEQIRKVGDEAEYISCSDQKMHRIGADDINVTLPALSIIKGTNTLSVNTSIQPSNMYIKDNFDYKKVFTATRAIEDELPLNYKNIEDNDSTLSDYRIYGNTVGGESVGDRTGNLFDGSFIHRSVIGDTVGDDDPNRRSIVVDVSSYANGNKITFSRETSAGNQFQMYQVNSTLKGGKLLNTNAVSDNSEALLATITLDNISNYPYLMIFLNGATKPITDEELLASKIMVNVGNTPLPYEPYGYRVPVTVANGTDTVTTNIYIPEQLKMVGDKAEYVDYKEQKQHRIGADDINVTLPALPVLPGTNVLSVGTAVQPSGVYIKGKIKEIN